MEEGKYWERLLDSKNPYNLRLRMVKMYLDSKNYSLTAKAFSTSRFTVKKWVKRFYERGLEGLKEEKRGPKKSPRRTPEEIERVVVGLRKLFKGIGQEKIAFLLKKDYGIKLAPRTIHRILDSYGLIKKRKKKPHRRRGSKEFKEYLKSLEIMEFDTKDLIDILSLREKIKKGQLPRYQFTARDPKSGLSFISFAYICDSTNAGVFAWYIFSHLDRLNILPRAKTDNGREYFKFSKKKRRKNSLYSYSRRNFLQPASTHSSFHSHLQRRGREFSRKNRERVL